MRPARAEDFPFIANSFLKSYKGAPEARCLDSKTYYADYTERLKKLVLTAETTVACADDDEDQILGYIIGEKFGNHAIVDYLYVKYPFRCLGVGKALVRSLHPEFGQTETVVTHQPKNWNTLSKKYKLVYLPSARK